MLNPFPDLLVYSLLAPSILRVVVGFIFINLGLIIFRGERLSWINSLKILRIPKPEEVAKALGIIQIVGGIMLVVGFYTQIAALILAVLTLKELYIEYKESSILKRDLAFYLMLFAITLSLLLSGAGAFAVDIPL